MPKPLLTCRNESRGTVLGDKIRKADNYFTRLLGLLPKKSLAPGEGLWIVPCKDIHSVGMKFLFDAVFLDKKGLVVHLIESMPPMKLGAFIKTAHTVVELPAGTIADSQTQLGDQITVSPN